MRIKNWKSSLLVSCVLGFAAMSPLSAQGDGILGMWSTPDGATVEIFECETMICGKIVAAENESAVGTQILHGFVEAGDNEWKDGKVFSPARNREFNAELKLEDETTLNVRVSAGLRGRTLKWNRVS